MKKWIAAWLSVCLIFGSVLPVMAEDTYKLSVDESTCTVSVLDTSGKVILSTNPTDPAEDEYTAASALNNLCSQLVVTYYDSKNVDSVVGSYLSSIRYNTFKITKGNNQIRIDYDFSRKNERFKIPVEYSLKDGKFQVRVLSDEIEEYGEKRIHKIAVVPYLLRGTSDMDGYLLIPDGSGAKINFSNVNPYAATYSSQIYGRNVGEAQYYEEGNAWQVHMPVFGADYGDHGILAKVDGNASAGIIEANCVGSDSSYAHAYAAFVYRIFDTVTIAGNDWRYKEYVADSEVTEKEDFSVSYHIVKEGGLMKLAEKCREISENLPDLPDKAVTGALYAYGLTSQRAAFLGIPYTKTIEATTFDDVSDMLGRLSKDNPSLAVMLQDFDKASVKGSYPSGIKWSSAVGGKKAFEKLVSEYGKQHQFYCVQDFLYENTSLPLWLRQHKYAKMASNEILARFTYSPVTYAHTKTQWYGLNLSSLKNMASKALEKAYDSFCGVALEGLGRELYGDYSRSKGVSRTEFQRGIETILKKQEGNLPLAVDGGNEYLFGKAELYYNFPVSSSSYDIETESVPFMQLVYHGKLNMVSSAINMTDAPQREALNCVAGGTIPCFAVTGMKNDELRRSGYKTLFNTCFETQEEMITAFFARTSDYYKSIYDQQIVSYEQENGISITTYESGIRAVVNYTDQAFSYEGTKVAPMDFAILD